MFRQPCPAEIGSADRAYAAQRMVNLMGAWHSQLIEVLGAMGIREVRRLRGEVGRAIFMEDIEKEAFGDLARCALPTGVRMTGRAGRRQAVRVRLSDWPQEQVTREVPPAPDRYRNALGKYKIDRPAACVSCGRCAEVCAYGVHVKPEGYAFTLRPQDHLCIGPDCAETDHSCVAQCPQKALTMRRNPSADCMGDPRWSSDLILSTWHQAATGHAPPPHLEYRHGASGGGFDKLLFKFEVEGFERPAPVPAARSTRAWT